MKITDTTALNVLVRTSHEGTTESDLFHSGLYDIDLHIQRLRQKGYHIQERRAVAPNNTHEMRWFINLQQIQDRTKVKGSKV